MGCLICKSTQCKTFMLNMCCGDSPRTIKDYIIEFVGPSIAGYLDETQGVCKICKHMLDEIVTSKYEIFRAIRLAAELKYVPKLGKYWTFCSKSADNNTFDFTSNPSPEPKSRDTTPLMSVTRTKMYNGPIEQIFETREGLKNELRSDNIQQGNIGLKKGRMDASKSNRSKSAAIHKMKQVIREHTQRVQSEPQDRSISVASNMSVISSASNMRDIDASSDQDDENERNELRKTCKCPYEECKTEDFKGNCNEYTSHMIEKHNWTPYYKCEYCDFEYFIREHLKSHLKKHDTFPVLCGLCGIQTPTVAVYQQHMDRHFESSFKCIFCDMAFCTKKECNKHIFSNHRHRRRIFLRRKASQSTESIILNQIDHKKPNISSERTSATSTDTVNNNKCTEMKIACFKPEQFTIKTFRELDFIQRHPPNQCEPHAFSLGDNVVQGENLDQRIKTELTNFGKLNDLFDKIPHRSNLARGKSGLAAPMQRSNTPFSEELDMFPYVGSNNYYKTRRDLESTSTEIANCLNGGEDSDRESDTEEEPSDFESENQYLDGNTFLSSIPSPYNSIEKS